MSGFRLARVVLLLGFLLLLLTLHGRGSTYNTLHVVYIVLLVALLSGSLFVGSRRRRTGSGGPGGQRRGPMAGGGGGFGSPPTPAPPVMRDNADPEAEGPTVPSGS
jgi:hypothetical protein